MRVAKLASLLPALAIACGGTLAVSVWGEVAFQPSPASIERSTGDLPIIRRRHGIRVLLTYNKTNYFILNGRARGFEYEMFQQYGKFLNKGLTRKQIKTGIVYLPVPFERLIPALLEGKGDVAAAGLTVTPERLQKVAFTEPYLPNVDEIVVTHRKAKQPQTLDDLSGKTLYVLRSSSYARHLRMLNQRLKTKRKAPIKIVEASENLATEDILEMVNAGIIDSTVADHHIATIWSGALKNLVLRDNLKVHAGGKIAWAVRKNNPQLLQSLNAFVKKNRKGTLTGNLLFQRYYKDTRWIKNPLEAQEQRKLNSLRSLFKKYGDMYGIEWLVLAAQAYQESGLDHRKKSKRGAIGIMQVLPSTAADPNINIPNIRKLENNIHAGAKYLSFLRTQYFSDSNISPGEQINFSFAAYNAGPRKVQHMRRKAKTLGLNPNQWFFHVERAALRVVGQETVRYVANIHKYYISYRLVRETRSKRARERGAFKPR